MVPVLSIVGMLFSLCIAVVLPLVLLIVLRIKAHKGLLAALVGAFCFFSFALLLEPLLHAVVLPHVQAIPWLYVLYGCLAAGVFEETGRLMGLSFLCKWRHKKDATLATGLAYGIGHGGFEAAFLVGSGMLANLMFALTLNTRGIDAVIQGGSGVAPEQIQAVVQQMQTMSPMLFFAGGFERISAIALHIALSLLVWMVVTGRVPFAFYFVSIALHALTNVGAALMQSGVLKSLAFAEIYTFAVVVAVWVLVLTLYRRSKPHAFANDTAAEGTETQQ